MNLSQKLCEAMGVELKVDSMNIVDRLKGMLKDGSKVSDAMAVSKKAKSDYEGAVADMKKMIVDTADPKAAIKILQDMDDGKQDPSKDTPTVENFNEETERTHLDKDHTPGKKLYHPVHGKGEISVRDIHSRSIGSGPPLGIHYIVKSTSGKLHHIYQHDSNGWSSKPLK